MSAKIKSGNRQMNEEDCTLVHILVVFSRGVPVGSISEAGSDLGRDGHH